MLWLPAELCSNATQVHGTPLQLVTKGQPLYKVITTQLLALLTEIVDVPEANGVKIKTSSSAVK